MQGHFPQRISISPAKERLAVDLLGFVRAGVAVEVSDALQCEGSEMQRSLEAKGEDG
jgi:hypothetical protein